MIATATGMIKCHTDDWTDYNQDGLGSCDGHLWTGWTDFEIETRNENRPIEGSTTLSIEPTAIETSTNDLQPTAIEIDLDETRQATTGVPIESEEEDDNETLPRGRVRDLDQDSDEDEASPRKRTRLEYLDLMTLTLDQMMAKKQKKEIRLRNLDGIKKERFMTAIRLEIQNNLDTGAYEVVDLAESEKIRRDQPDKILQSKYVLTEKPSKLTMSKVPE